MEKITSNTITITMKEPYPTNAKIVAAILRKGTVSGLFRYLLDKEIKSNSKLKILAIKHE